ncbi:hypothetical protein PAMP_012585 [Pampus punctatissimus]
MEVPSPCVLVVYLCAELIIIASNFFVLSWSQQERRFSPVWQHFELISDTKVKCLLCSKELGYNNNTSMLRHYRALHENKEAAQPSSDWCR